MKHRDLELEFKLDTSGNPIKARVMNHSEIPNSWFPVPKGTSVDQAKTFTRGMELACWRAGYEDLRRRK
jgi:hypothetical protein